MSSPLLNRLRVRLAVSTITALGTSLLIVASGGSAALAADSVDITDSAGVVSDQFNVTGTDGIDKAVDNVDDSKYLTYQRATWLQFRPQTPAVVDRYALTSGNDYPIRDPRNWTLQASADGSTWTTLDTRTDQAFSARFQKRLFSFANTTAYAYYRLAISANNGDDKTQLAEWELWTPGDGTPSVPAGLVAVQVTPTEADLAWSDTTDVATRPAAYPPTGYEIQRSTDGGEFATVATAKGTGWTDAAVADGKTYRYRVRALGVGSHASAFTTAVALTGSTERDITDTAGSITDQFNSTGGEGVDKAVDNTTAGKYVTGNKATWLQFQPRTRAIVDRYAITSGNDIPGRDPRNWTLQGSVDGSTWTALDTRSGEAFEKRFQKRLFSFANTVPYPYYRLSVTANNGDTFTQLAEWELWTPGEGTPAAPSDLVAVQVTPTEADLAWTDTTDVTTRPAAYPPTGYEVQRSTDGGDFTTVATARNTGYTDAAVVTGKAYRYRVRALGVGEHVSAFTAAVAMVASGERDITDSAGRITDQFTSTGGEGVDKAVDNTTAGKYVTGNKTTWLQFQPQTRAVVDRYAITSGNDLPGRDPRNWTLQGSVDGSTWTALDTRTGETFENRFQKRLFSFANTVPYPYYRLTVTANNGDTLTQLAEWELWTPGDRAVRTPADLAAARVTATEADLTWTDTTDVGARPLDYPPTGYEIQRSTDGAAFVGVATTDAGVTRYTDTGAATGTSYRYRIRALGIGAHASAFTAAVALTATSEQDITDSVGTISDQYTSTGGEGVDKSVDNSVYTKYVAGKPQTFLQFEQPVRSVASRYTLTSGNDLPERDPVAWAFQGSTDGVSWATLDSRSGQTFTGRHQLRTFAFTNSVPYRFYRLNVTANNGGPLTQISEWQIFATAAALPTPRPVAPTALTAQAVSGDQVRLTWQDNSPRWERALRLQRSTDGSTWTSVKTLPAGETGAIDLGLSGNTAYSYRVRAENATANSDSVVVTVTTPTGQMPATWKEHGLGHTALVTKVFQDKNVAVYVDPDVDPSQTWIYDFTSRLWGYTKQNYGTDFSNPTLMVVLHRQDIGGHAESVFGSIHDYRNVIDVGASDMSPGNNGFRDTLSHEMNHVIESYSGGVSGSPSFSLWGDSKWAEIYQYDAYLGAGLQADADRWYDHVINGKDGFPRPDTPWMKEWFFPIWQDGGQGKTLARYFQLLGANFAQHNGSYDRQLNWGEFVHFWSGAAGTDLSGRAALAFGSAFDRVQFEQAQKDYPAVTYAPAACQSGSVPCRPIQVSYPGVQRFVRGASVALTVTASGPNPSDVLTFTASGLPAGLSVSSTGKITGSPSSAGTGRARVTVTSGKNTGSSTFTWTVT